MKKFFAVLLAVIFVFGILSGCGKKEEKAMAPAKDIHFGTDLSVAQFKENINALMDVGEAVHAETNNIIAYTLKGEPKYKVDGKIKFTGGSISLPNSHNDMIKNGFVTQYNDTDQVYNEMQGQAIVYDNEEGTVGMKFYLDEEADDYGTISDVSYTTVVMDRDDGYIPQFELIGGITSDSKVEDIIKAYGMPKTLAYDAFEKRVHMDYKTADGNYMLFQFSPEGSEMALEVFELKYVK